MLTVQANENKIKRQGLQNGRSWQYKVFDAAVVDTLLLIVKKGNSNKQQKFFLKSVDRNLKTIKERLTSKTI